MIETVIVLAAGRGTRLRPWTDDRPKCMVPLHGRPLLEWQLDAIRAAGARRIVVVRGYRAESIAAADIETVDNPRFAETNMVASLDCARAAFGAGFVLAYSDIVYRPELLRAVLACDAPVACAVDEEWLPYWRARFEDPLSDAETLRVRDDHVVEIGGRARTVEEIEGQFVGLVGFRGEGVAHLVELLDRARALQAEGRHLDGCPRIYDAMYTTDLLQALADDAFPPRAVPVHGGWLEIDGPTDLALAERSARPEGSRLAVLR